MKFPVMKMRKPRPGFTLIELLVVMGIILVLAGIVVGVQRGVYHQQSQARAKADMQAIANALETFKLRYGDYPWIQNSETGLFNALTGARVLRKGTNGYDMLAPSSGDAVPLIDVNLIETDDDSTPTYFQDPWGSAYVYYYKTSADDEWNHSGYILISAGPDRDIGDVDGFDEGDFPQSSGDYYGDSDGDNFDPDDERFDNILYGLERD